MKQQRAEIQLHCAPLCPLYQNQILIYCARSHLEIELLYPNPGDEIHHGSASKTEC